MTEERIFSVYIHRFPNGKQYAGITRAKPKRRWSNGNGYINNQPMYKDIKLYGWDNIEHILFNDEDILYTEEEAFYIEKNLISSWDLMNEDKGYNRVEGGISSYTIHKSTIEKRKIGHKIKPVTSYSLEGIKITEYPSINEAARQTGLSAGCISQCCRGIIKSSGGFIWKPTSKKLNKIKPLTKHKGIPVIQYSADGEKIAEYVSAKYAEKQTGICKSNIYQCCRGTYKAAGGYQWRHKADNLEMIEPTFVHRPRVVKQLSLTGEYIAEFNSITEADRMTGVNRTNISACCRGIQQIAGDYKWEYKD